MSLTFFPQELRTSCTVACLRMVLNHWGVTESEVVLRECCRTTEQGSLGSDVVSCAEKYGLSAYEAVGAGWQELISWQDQGIYPIVLLNLFPLKALWVRHAVVIESAIEDTVTYLDPTYGRQVASRVSFEQAWAMNRNRAIVIHPLTHAKD